MDALDQLPLAAVSTAGRDVSWEKSGIFSGSVKAAGAAAGAPLCACMCTAGLVAAADCAITLTFELVAHVKISSATTWATVR